jgi:hypothetical protein
MCGVSPASAANVVFTGSVDNTCDLSVMLPPEGTLALSADHTILGSDQTGGLPVELTIASIGANTINVAAPTLTDSPVGYVSTGQSLEIGYVGVGLLNLVSKAMGTGGGSFSAGILGLTGSTILINARIVNANGFKLGDYQLTSVVTCS